MTLRVMTSATGVRAGSFSPATTRFTTSRSVKIPWIVSPSETRTEPIRRSRMSRHASRTLAAGRTVMTSRDFFNARRSFAVATKESDPMRSPGVNWPRRLAPSASHPIITVGNP